jgi:hypothetical protein
MHLHDITAKIYEAENPGKVFSELPFPDRMRWYDAAHRGLALGVVVVQTDTNNVISKEVRK